jgi:hypothetical protein
VKDARARADVEALRARGLDPATAEAAALFAAFESDPALGAAVSEALGDRATPESAALLRRIEGSAEARKDKELRRAVRRALYRLAQKGIVPPAEPPESPRLATAAPARATDAEGFLSPLDSQGDRLLWIVKPRPGGVWHSSVVVNEPGGLKESVLAETTRKAIRTLRGELAKRHGVRMVEVDARYVDWIASEGFERARAAGSLSASAASHPSLRLQLFLDAPAPAPSPIRTLISADEVRGDAALLRDAASLFEADLRLWFLPARDFETYLARVRGMRDSPIVLDRHQQRGQLEEILVAAITEIFGGERKASWIRRLEEMSWVLAKGGRRDPARALFASALALEASESGGREIPFFETLVRRTFGLFLMEEAEREEEQKSSSVLVTPDDVRAEQRARGRPGPKIRG